MSGERYLLDTNAIIAVLRGHKVVLERLQDAQWVGISILSHIEFQAFPDLPDEDKLCFAQFLDRVEVVGLDNSQPRLVEQIIEARRLHRLKLPDAIIVGTALYSSASLVTGDRQLLSLPGISSVSLP